MKYTFLDIDGVVATYRAMCLELENYRGAATVGTSYKTRALNMLKEHDCPPVSMIHWPFDQEAISQLYRLQRETDCQFVVSSTWRIGTTVKDLQYTLNLKGLRILIYDFTGRGYSRGQEIEAWLGTKDNVDSFVILDDEVYDITGKRYQGTLNLKAHTVQTGYELGFTKELCDQALKILGT